MRAESRGGALGRRLAENPTGDGQGGRGPQGERWGCPVGGRPVGWENIITSGRNLTHSRRESDREGQMESAVRIPPRLMSGRDRHVRAISCAGSLLLGPFVGPAPHWAWPGPLQARGGAEILPCPLRAGVRCPTPGLDGMPCGHQ